MAVADFNRDGKADLAIANGDSNDVSILLGNGDGTFGLRRRRAALPPGSSVVPNQAGTSPYGIATGTSTATARRISPLPI
ncbi:MAG TPA: VCBS repeat-containing protein [Thermoanaerobaculia bacterium]|nr:VCBS repeat-containing protein [Thermoanaerobaculia bacterium]